MINETRRKPTTGRQSPSLFDKCPGICYIPSRADTAGHTKAFDYLGRIFHFQQYQFSRSIRKELWKTRVTMMMMIMMMMMIIHTGEYQYIIGKVTSLLYTILSKVVYHTIHTLQS